MTNGELVLAIVAGLASALGAWVELRRDRHDVEGRERLARAELRIEHLTTRIEQIEKVDPMATNYEDQARFLRGQWRRVTTVADTYTATLDDDYIVADSGGGGTFTITLPPAADAYDAATQTGKILTFVNVHTDDVTIDGDASETINGATTFLLDVQYERVSLVSDGTAWYNV